MPGFLRGSMSMLQWVDTLSEKDVKKLMGNIDVVLFDIDGVLLHTRTVLPGAIETVTKLRNLGKKIGFVTNNSIYPQQGIAEGLKTFGASKEEVVTPTCAFLEYLKKIDFKKDLYVIGSVELKRVLKEAGYKIIEYKDIQPVLLDEYARAPNGLFALITKTMQICKNVGLVYVDTDFNFILGSLQVAKVLINHMDAVIFACGAADDLYPVDDEFNVIMPKFYIDGLERWTKRKPVAMAKPGQVITDYVISKFGIVDRSRVLMIGDNVLSDITFGVEAGMKTCLTLSGVTKKNEVENWAFRNELKPNFVIKDLQDINCKL